MDDQGRLLGENPEIAEHRAPLPSTLSETDRAVALLQGPPRMPRRAMGWLLTVCAVLGLGGVIGDHYFSGTSSTSSPPATTSPPSSQQNDVRAPISALMGLKTLGSKPAHAFSLREIDGKVVSLSSFRGDVVVLSFFDATCDDICPVLGSELSLAAKDLGQKSAKVVFLVVNTDPLATSTASVSPEVARVLGSGPHWHFLTGSIGQLDPVWTAYGVTIDVQRSSSLVAHNDVLYFIDPQGRLRLMALPFADETIHRRFSLPSVLVDRWASGIAAQASSLLSSSS